MLTDREPESTQQYYARLSAAAGQLADSVRCTAVVVGSGYGGSITAARLAAAGVDVVVLERGREIIPGHYPRDEWDALAELQVERGPGERLGSRQAMFDLRLGGDMTVVVACGLGGGSLINANVCLRPDPSAELFQDRVWPEALRGSSLDRHYAMAEGMLGARAYPAGHTDLHKLVALSRAATKLGRRFVRPPLAVSFEDGPNAAGIHQRACTLCGDCCSGCNYGAKNTTLMNYLPLAHRHGARLFTGVSVRSVQREGARWRVHCEDLEARPADDGARPLTIDAEIVVLAAGSLGSTEILLRSTREHGLELSAQIGARFSGNGDVLGFAYGMSSDVFGVGAGAGTPTFAGRPGPCIAGSMAWDAAQNDGIGCRIQEGVIPGALGAWLAHAFLLASRAQGGAMTVPSFAELRSLMDGPYTGTLRRTLTLLGIGHDRARGRLALRGDHLALTWPDAAQQPELSYTLAALQQAAEAMGARFITSPLPGAVTVHPLGGCAMADSSTDGVVNHKGQVFARPDSERVHGGLYVCDGAIVPRSLGVNPLLTICALAERNAELLLQDRASARDSPGRRSPLPNRAPRPGLRFSEFMQGYARFGDELAAPAEADFCELERAHAQGQPGVGTCGLRLTLLTDDVEGLIMRAPHDMAAQGSVELPLLHPEPLAVEAGRFQLFGPAAEDPQLRTMRYELQLRDGGGERYRLVARKCLHARSSLALWAETTTVSFELMQGPRILARGAARIEPAAFIRQLGTMTILDADSTATALGHLTAFGLFFAGELYSQYAPQARGGTSAAEYRARRRRLLQAPEREVHVISGPKRGSEEGPELTLTRYRLPAARERVILAPGFGVAASSFAIDTVEVNLVEYLAARGFEPWLFDYRASPALIARVAGFSIDTIAEQDWPAAVERVLETGPTVSGVHVIAHCVGSMSLLMALLNGRLSAQRVKSAICSQLPLHASGWWVSQLAASADLARRLRRTGLETVDIHNHGELIDGVVNAFLRANPVPRGFEAEDGCSNTSCRRIFALFGPTYKHDRLNRATHDAIHEMFGRSRVEPFEHLSRILRHGHVVNRDGHNTYATVDRLRRLRLPLLFFAGADNQLFSPRSSERTLELLASINGPDWYRSLVLKDYAHMDCFIGQDAHNDVFPHFVQFLQEHA